MKSLLLALFVFGAGFLRAGEGHTSVLLTPVDASRASSYDWVLVTLPESSLARGGTGDSGSIIVNVDMAKLFQEGYAIYSITKVERKDQNVPSLVVLIGPTEACGMIIREGAEPGATDNPGDAQ